jgi:hypothetical protein
VALKVWRLARVVFVASAVTFLCNACASTQHAPSARVNKYLEDQGKLVLVFRHLSAPILIIPKSANAPMALAVCRQVAGDLNAHVDPAKLGEEAASIPDATLSEVALDERTVRSSALVACGHGDLSTMQAELTRARSLAASFSARLESVR